MSGSRRDREGQRAPRLVGASVVSGISAIVALGIVAGLGVPSARAVEIQPRMGEPLTGLTPTELGRFLSGQTQFNRVLTPPEGLGPVFNQNACGTCHNNPLGGSGSILVTRFGFSDEEAGTFDPLVSQGGSLLQSQAISIQCAESVPATANVTAQRLTNSPLGFGLVEAIDDFDIEMNAMVPPPGVSGVVHTVELIESPGTFRVGRFGWKAQLATVLSFSADAALNEMGFTNRFLMTENDPNGVDPPSLGSPDFCDTVADPEDLPDAQGFDFVDRVTDFQRFLAPPPQTPRSGMTGEAVFTSIGCASCHAPSFTTKNDISLETAIRNKTIRPYSDFLLHNMGLNADFIPQGNALADEMRTPPLWGIRVRDPMWHDGRQTGGTFTDRILGVIGLHDALLSEGQTSAQAFAALSQADKDALVAFLDSLGRAEFDIDGDGVIGPVDYQDFLACFTGPGSFYTPDDPCSISDIDQDGDVDDTDFGFFVQAANDGVSGEVGASLLVARGVGDSLDLSWGASCLGGDLDYEVYQGTLGTFTSHVPVLCSTSGAMAATVTPAAGDSVFILIVPSNGFREGSYGSRRDGTPRPPGTGACFPQAAGACR